MPSCALHRGVQVGCQQRLTARAGLWRTAPPIGDWCVSRYRVNSPVATTIAAPQQGQHIGPFPKHGKAENQGHQQRRISEWGHEPDIARPHARYGGHIPRHQAQGRPRNQGHFGQIRHDPVFLQSPTIPPPAKTVTPIAAAKATRLDGISGDNLRAARSRKVTAATAANP